MLTSNRYFFQTLSPSKRATVDASVDSVVEVVDVADVRLDENIAVEKKKKIPRRVLHFSDGIVEEYRSRVLTHEMLFKISAAFFNPSN